MTLVLVSIIEWHHCFHIHSGSFHPLALAAALTARKIPTPNNMRETTFKKPRQSGNLRCFTSLKRNQF